MARKSAEVENNNIQISTLSKERTWMDFAKGQSLLMNPGKTEWRLRFINTLLMWAEKESSLEIIQFCIEYKMGRSTLYEWAEKYKDISSALSHARLMIACHRRVGSMRKELDGGHAYRDMHLYDPEWHAVNKYHNDMKVEQEKQAHTFIINDSKPKVLSKEEMKGEKDE